MKKSLLTLATLIAIISSPFLLHALSIPVNRTIVGAEQLLYPTDSLLVGAAATTTTATLEVAGNLGVTGSATSTFAGPVSVAGWTLATSSSLEVCFYPDHCQYQVSPTSTSSDVQINAALLAGGQTKTPVHIKGYGTTTPYIISNLLQLPSNVIFYGDGKDVSVIKADVGYSPATSVYGICSQCGVMLIGLGSNPIYNDIVQGITLDGNVANFSRNIGTSLGRLIWIQNATNLTLDRNKIFDGANWTVYVALSDQIHIQNNTVLGGYSSVYNQNDGIHVRDSTNFYIQNNYIDTAVGGGTSGDDTIAFVQDSAAIQDMVHGVITGNIINSSGSRGIVGDFGNTVFHIRDITIANNIIASTTHAGIKMYTEDNRTGQYYGINITGNVFSRIGTNGSDGGHSIFLDQDYGTARNIYNDISITGNVFRSNVYASAYVIDVQGGSKNLVVSNNIIDNSVGLGGIRIGTANNPSTDYTINGNNLNLSTGASGGKGISIFGSPRGVITGNEIQGNKTGTTYCIYITSDGSNSSNNLDVSHNTCYNFVNGFSEVNAGANPNSNQYAFNTFNTITTPYTIIGANSTSIGNNGITLSVNPTNGRVGIGTASPAQALDVRSIVTIRDATGASFLDSGQDNVNGSINSSNTLRFQIGGVSQLSILNNGSITLATTTAGCLNTNALGLLYSATCSGGSGIVNSGTTGQIPYYAGSGTTLTATSTIFISTASNVGIGNITPNSKLDITSLNVVPANTTQGQLNIRTTDAEGIDIGGSITLGGYNDSGQSAIRNFAGIVGAKDSGVSGTSSGYLKFLVNTSGVLNEKARITSAGFFGIGTSTPYANLSVQSGASTGDAFAVATSSGAAVFGVDNDGHTWTSGPAPVISVCGTGSGTVVGDDQSGTITTATAATACTMTFSKAYRKTPTCTVTDNSLVGFADISTISTSAVTFGISSALTGGLLFYNCQYHQ